uniref:Uncharacterized protein n=1 Tax=Anguilla anguilla TaxID=7936 RepID=A0A0E9P9U9_ANGAN
MSLPATQCSALPSTGREIRATERSPCQYSASTKGSFPHRHLYRN